MELLAQSRPSALEVHSPAPDWPYFADFVCRRAKQIVELDGQSHDLNSAYDGRRDEFLRAAGYRVVRILSADMLTNADGVIAKIEQALLIE